MWYFKKPRTLKSTILLFLIVAFFPRPSEAQSLKGSAAAVARAYKVAHEQELTFVKTSAQVQGLVRAGRLLEVVEGVDLALHRVSFPFVVPAMVMFLQKLAPEYRSHCGEKLVVTSLMRPIDRQPPNASRHSVHPAGMAVDLRRSKIKSCRSWLESFLLELEGEGVLEATRERHPPHYHVSLFPSRYTAYLERLESGGPAYVAEPTPSQVTSYIVQTGDSLWSIAQHFKTTVVRMKQLNKLTSARIIAGQSLDIPGAEVVETAHKREPSVKAAP